MGQTYYKRFRLEIDLSAEVLAEPVLPAGYAWVPWDEALLARHARAKWYSFREELDAQVFPCLGTEAGCHRLMEEIATRDTFVAEATWLIRHEPSQDGYQFPEDCATIQALAPQPGLGSIQNVGVLPDHRGQELGRALVLKALHGFREAKMSRVFLEVTTANTVAVQLYLGLGFRLTKTSYKAVEHSPAEYSVQ